jgi:hypothetical protein
MAVGPVSFALEPPDVPGGPPAPAAGAQNAAAGGEGAAPAAQEPMEGVLPPPRVPYAPDPGTYTRLWMSQTSTKTTEENKQELVNYLDAYAGSENPDYNAIQSTMLTSGDWYGFLTILPDNQICLVHSLGKHSSGLGRPTSANNRIFGLLGEKVGDQLPPLIMAPSVGLIPWLKIQELKQPTMEDLAGLAGTATKTLLLPQEAAREEEEATEADEKASVQSICYVPKAWAAHFLAPMSPWEALQTFRSLRASVPPADHEGFEYIEAWLMIACTHTVQTPGESVLCARWQRPYSDRKVLQWINRHSRYVNQMPAGTMPAAAATITTGGLDPQECFNRALETVAALKPVAESKKYSTAELQRIRAACSLSIAEMETSLPPFHARLLAEGRTKRGTESVLAQALRPRDDTDDPGLIYVSPELVADIMACKYGLGWDTSYRNCHRGLSPFAVPHMSLRHQQERVLYQDRLGKATMTTIGDVEKGEETPSTSPKSYHGCLQLLSNYIKLLTEVVGLRSAHLREVIAIRSKLRQKVDLYIDMGPKEILFLLWAIFLDAREVFSRQIGDTDTVPESQLKYTTSFLGVGRIPMDILGVPVAQFGASNGGPSTAATDLSSLSSNRDELFKPAEFVAPKNASVPDDISAITMPLMDKFPQATANALMAHGSLNFEDIRVGNKGACLNYNLLGICSDPKCSYRHSRAKPTPERIKQVVEALKPTIQSYLASGGTTDRKRKRGAPS